MANVASYHSTFLFFKLLIYKKKIIEMFDFFVLVRLRNVMSVKV